MPTITIDNRRVEVPTGATILDAARRLGIDVPTLCHRDGYEPSASCLVCVVKVRGRQRLVPACATVAMDGMEVESETPEVHHARRTALELLLSDHQGDCLAPCQLACPAHMDVPLMLRQIRDGQFRQAIVTIKNDIALPAVLGRVCGKPCEKGCRRAAADGPVAVCALKARMAELDLASDEPYRPSCRADSGKRVAIVGAGPCGLAAAYHLARAGHRVTLIDRQSKAGGRLRREFDAATLPDELIDAEIAQIVRLDVVLRLDVNVGDRASFDRLRADHDAVLVACGAEGRQLGQAWGLTVGPRGIEVDKKNYRTCIDSVYAAGDAIRGPAPVVRDVADGKEAAASIDAFLTGTPAAGTLPLFTVRSGRLPAEQVARLIEITGAAGVSPVPSSRQNGRDACIAPPEHPSGPAALLLEQARHEAARCLHCDCGGRGACRLRIYAQQYDARPARFQGTRRVRTLLRGASGVVFDSGKCIDCGLCIQVAARRRDLLGLTFIGRGFDVRVGVPMDGSLDEALGDLAAECVAVCPTAALSMETEAAGKPPQTEPRP
ncbi:MAG: FAD-dependent oxidoreductase [Pirellulales bacterium]|nr:FAD-dependent oxidoreductase [Pirellulales bacterium]